MWNWPKFIASEKREEMAALAREGRTEGRVDVARELLRMGMAAGSIAKATDLSEGEIQALQKDDDNKPAVS